MLADFFSKPQQGSLYTRFRDMVMGITPVPPVEDPSLTCPTSQERVGSSIFGAGGQRTDGENMTKMTRPTVTWADRVRGFAGGIARPESLGPAHKKKLVNRNPPNKRTKTDICPSVRSDVSNCFHQGVSNEWSPREQFQHAPNSEDQSRRDVQKRDVQLEHHMSCTRVHTHVANGQAHQNGRLVCGVQPVIFEDSALALLFFRKNMEAACATKDHFLTGGDKLWHGAPELEVVFLELADNVRTARI
ncbi:unnamed protein product [Cylindrotheca closterium]|nr:unnamed protein product [Cylindrotheca closterium]